LIVALALAMSAPIDRRDAMERCAEAVIAARHPNMGMLDITGTTFEWLSTATAGDDWVIIGSIIEPDGTSRVARRFTCRTRGDKPPRIAFGKVVRL
jgi:hypothetical protein